MNCRDSVRTIVVGLGQQAQGEVLPALLKNEGDYTVVALCDTNPAHLNAAKDLFPAARTYTDYHKCVRSEQGVSVAVLSLPHYLYAPVVQLCLDSGIDVFKEKPLARTYLEATTLVRQSASLQRRLFVVTKRNFYKSYSRARSLLSELGTVYQYTAKHFVTGGNVHFGWKSRFQEAGGGVLINLAYHLLEQLIRCFGNPVSQHMFFSNVGKDGVAYEIEDSATIMLMHESGVYGSFQFNCYTGVKQEILEIHGTRGTLVVQKNNVSLYSSEGIRILYEMFDSADAVVYSDALQFFKNASLSDLRKHLSYHEFVMKTISALYADCMPPHQ